MEENPYFPVLMPLLATPTLVDTLSWYEALLAEVGTGNAATPHIQEQIGAAREAVLEELRRRGDDNEA